MKKIFSGIQPTNVVHIGNYLGAIKNWVALQDGADQNIYCIVDLHAITIPQDPKQLQENILKMAALYIACGINPEKPARNAEGLPEVATTLQAGIASAGGSTIFVQSSRPEHTELAWILNCHASMGELQRMTQFKEKSEKQKNYSVGLFDYPALMAADILLYQTTHVPVGEDQKQHIELTRDLAQRLNSKYGDVFTVPEPIINKSTARIMALDDPSKKMSKSASSALSYIALTDDAETIKDKVKRAVTDSGSEIRQQADKPAITNLLNIFSAFSGKSIGEIEKEFEGKGYGEFKEALAETIITALDPIQAKYNELMNDRKKLADILDKGSRTIAPIAQKTLNEVKNKIGLG